MIPELCGTCPRLLEARRKIRFAQLLTKATEDFKERLKTEDIQEALHDYLKLLQMQIGFEAAGPDRTTVL